MKLTGKNILVTGAAKGIGRQLAIEAASRGANIAVHYYQSEEEASNTIEEVKKFGVEVISVKADLADFQEAEAMKNKIFAEFGPIDGIVNNAGYAQMKSFFEYEPEEWKKEVDVCLHGVLNLAYIFVPGMKERGQGKFVNIVGDSARTGDRHLIVSAAARNGAISFLKSLAKEVGRDHIQCNTVSIGMIDQGEFTDDMIAKMVRNYPMKRLGNAADVSGAVLFLLSDEADWITGQVLSVNGGHNMFG
ncbi:SDR family oxidoreductase [Oceanobacillus piezotolerans]|uniref:SDR family oxidoreductase n=1 Tax=Oceanobacillus piezotolerans TaxID=2448030 RepID=A0A498DK73_9BACI|nr:SDR family oxidoreductase [Oceanobacillus piezotolerans]RLL46882.1 SDR family oxidoreductase [Oceanobacillus piezotolerans]